MSKAADRRTTRTKALLQKAHVDVMLKKGYEAMTIQDICDAANVGRSTFYAHYKSKGDLRRGSFEHLRMLLVERRSAAAAASGRGLGFSLALFQHAKEYLPLYRALAGSRGAVLGLGAIRKILLDLVADEFGARRASGPESLPQEVAVQYVVGAYMAVLTWWLDQGAKASPEKLDEAFQRMVYPGVREFAD